MIKVWMNKMGELFVTRRAKWVDELEPKTNNGTTYSISVSHSPEEGYMVAAMNLYEVYTLHMEKDIADICECLGEL